MNVRRGTNILIWIVVGLLFAGIGVWAFWASRQPETHSVWAPE